MNTETKELRKAKKKLKHKTQISKERQTVVHCTYNPLAAVRVWPSTFLIEKESGRMAKLITAFNISFAPEWTFGSTNNCFTLVFEGLSKGCAFFDLVEDIPLPAPFVVKNIPRNKTDVYNVMLE
ncbi:MAG TPA: hypothetical protein VNZ49_12315 [Bacteroidia bacterium]|nr:hypothetical protein [Bacteroidia bacterium]